MLYCSWDMARDRCNYFSFWTIFCPFTPLTAWKIKINKKNEKKHLKISSFYKSIPKIMIIFCTVPEIWWVTNVIVIFHFGLIFALYPPPLPPHPHPNSPKTQKRWKKTPEDIIILHKYTKNYDQMMYSSWDIVHDGQTDRWTDRQKKWHIEVGAPPKNLTFLSIFIGNSQLFK